MDNLGNYTNNVKSKITPRIIWIAVIAIIVIWMISSYNGMIRKSKAVDNSWANVEVQYQRRFDLIPNSIETVKGATEQEKTILTTIAQARTEYYKAKSDPTATQEGRMVAMSALNNAILAGINENYPTLKSLDLFASFNKDTLEGTENRIAVARKDYNDSVMALNTKIAVFPSNIIAKIFGVKERMSFTSDEGSQNAPKVDFSN